jgi:hypothetical protein
LLWTTSIPQVPFPIPPLLLSLLTLPRRSRHFADIISRESENISMSSFDFCGRESTALALGFVHEEERHVLSQLM